MRAAWQRGEAALAAGDAAEACRWLDYGHRLAPGDSNLRFSLATALLRAGRYAAAAAHFAALTAKGGRECWTGLAAAAWGAGQRERAREALGTALSRHVADAGLLALAQRIAGDAWCAIGAAGLLCPAEPALVWLDGVAWRPAWRDGVARLPAGTRAAEIALGEGFAGSPLQRGAMVRVEGVCWIEEERVAGWAWHPGDPDRDPRLSVCDAEGAVRRRFLARGGEVAVDGAAPLQRPRGFSFPWNGEAVRIVAPDGRDLLGSPLPSRREAAARFRPRRPPAAPEPGIDVVVPVYRGVGVTEACLRSVLETVPQSTRVWAVDDAAPEAAMRPMLAALAAADTRLRIIPSRADGRNAGFPAAANAGMRAAGHRDVVLLNSDTLVAPFWLERLRDACRSAPDIGSAMPISNDATILSYPDVAARNVPPDLAGTRRLAALAWEANGGVLVPLPTAHGFCMVVRAECRAAVGGFRDALFAQGYGEENDWAERAARAGWRHVAVPGVYVAHLGGASFGQAARHLLRRNLALLETLHPGYHARIAAHVAADTLRPARRRLDARRWAAAREGRQSVLLISHGGGGGTARFVAERAAAVVEAGRRAIVLEAEDGLCRVGEPREAYPNLRFDLPAELDELAALLGPDRPVAAELHHLLGHDEAVLTLLARFAIRPELFVHDWSWFCPRLAFVTGDGRYCGEPPAAVCDECVARWGSGLAEPIGAAALRARSAVLFREARRVVVASEDGARRVLRHVPGSAVVRGSWESAAFAPARRAGAARYGAVRVAVVGAIGLEKGYEVLLACARDAAARDLNLVFTLIGYSSGDDALLETGRVAITGPFEREEAVGLIAAQSAALAFLPSVWPETWCYALSDAWAAGLDVAVFDIGAPAERVRRSGGRGWVLPLALPPARVNAFLEEQGTASAAVASASGRGVKAVAGAGFET